MSFPRSERIFHRIKHREKPITFLLLTEVITNNIILSGEERPGLTQGREDVLIGRERDKEGEGHQPHTDGEVGHHLRMAKLLDYETLNIPTNTSPH